MWPLSCNPSLFFPSLSLSIQPTDHPVFLARTISETNPALSRSLQLPNGGLALPLDLLRVLRVVRVLRPLRTVSASATMRVLVGTVFSSLPRLGNVSLLLFFFLTFFGGSSARYPFLSTLFCVKSSVFELYPVWYQLGDSCISSSWSKTPV